MVFFGLQNKNTGTLMLLEVRRDMGTALRERKIVLTSSWFLLKLSSSIETEIRGIERMD